MGKAAIRESVWETMDSEGIARFPFPPHGRIPNFAGADRAAARIAKTQEWEDAQTIKCNPDAPQRPVRQRALAAGKRLYMAVPRLREPDPFIVLDPESIPPDADASTIGGADEWGEPVGIDALEPIDLIVSGSVAVDTMGTRIGKGEGYSDLEYGLLRDVGVVTASTPVVTTVHACQVLEDALPRDSHDVQLTVIATPDRCFETRGRVSQPTGIDHALLSDDQLESIPVLSERFD